MENSTGAGVLKTEAAGDLFGCTDGRNVVDDPPAELRMSNQLALAGTTIGRTFCMSTSWKWLRQIPRKMVERWRFRIRVSNRHLCLHPALDLLAPLNAQLRICGTHSAIYRLNKALHSNQNRGWK